MKTGKRKQIKKNYLIYYCYHFKYICSHIKMSEFYDKIDNTFKIFNKISP